MYNSKIQCILQAEKKIVRINIHVKIIIINYGEFNLIFMSLKILTHLMIFIVPFYS
jgi:hypothetical protein